MPTTDSYEWLQAIADHCDTDNEALLAGYDILGAPTDLDDERLDAATFRLQLHGFLRVVDIDGGTWTHQIVLPACSAR